MSASITYPSFHVYTVKREKESEKGLDGWVVLKKVEGREIRWGFFGVFFLLYLISNNSKAAKVPQYWGWEGKFKF